MVIDNMGTGADKIGLDTNTSSTLNGNAYNISGALSNGVNIRAVADLAWLATDTSTWAPAASPTSRTPASCTTSADGDFTSGGTPDRRHHDRRLDRLDIRLHEVPGGLRNGMAGRPFGRPEPPRSSRADTSRAAASPGAAASRCGTNGAFRLRQAKSHGDGTIHLPDRIRRLVSYAEN